MDLILKKRESSDDILSAVYQEIDRLQLCIEDIEVDRAHRTGTSFRDRDGKLHQDVLVKFTSWQARNISKFQVNASLTGRLSDSLAYAKRKVNDQESMANKIVNYV